MKGYIPKYSTVEVVCEWLEQQVGGKWSLARVLESGVKPWFMLSREPHHNDPIHDELFGHGEAVYPAQILSERDIQNLAIDGREAIVRKISTYDGREADVGPVGLWRVPVHEIRFLGNDIQALAAQHRSSSPVPMPSPAPDSAPRRRRPEGGDTLTPLIWEICYDVSGAGKKPTPIPVMQELKIRAQSSDPKVRGPLMGTSAGGVLYETADGIQKELSRDLLAARIKEWRKASKRRLMEGQWEGGGGCQ